MHWWLSVLFKRHWDVTKSPSDVTVEFEMLCLGKSQFFCKGIQYLGFKLTTEDNQATPEKVAAIRNFPRPKN